jgi:hypothetical protein
MTEEQAPPDVSDPIEDTEPDSPDTSETDNTGIGIGVGVIGGAVVGVLGAIAVALWFGFEGRDTTDSPAALAEPAALERPASGADIIAPTQTGGGTLILENVGDVDGVVVLADERTYVRAIYVRSGDRVTVPNVATGVYEILMMLGLDWNATRFTRTPTYQRLEQPIEFTERDVDAATEYTQLTLSVVPVDAGVAGVRQVLPFQILAP